MLIVELLMAGAVASSPQPPTMLPPVGLTKDQAAAAERCRGGSVTHAADLGPPQQARKLGELPRARLERTVLRQVGGCVVPVIIRYEGEAPPPPKTGP